MKRRLLIAVLAFGVMGFWAGFMSAQAAQDGETAPETAAESEPEADDVEPEAGSDDDRPPPAPCEGLEYRQLDFWVGTWDLAWTDPETKRKHKGTNIVSKTLDGCVIEERFSGGAFEPLRGHSLSNYHRNKGEWRQLWVDNQGGYLPFAGGPVGERFILELRRFTDTDPYRRMVWENIEEDSLDWRWQTSGDEGATWDDLWHIAYERRSN